MRFERSRFNVLVCEPDLDSVLVNAFFTRGSVPCGLFTIASGDVKLI